MTKTEYLLVCLMEECAEVAHRASKALRFGMLETQENQWRNNIDRVIGEMADLEAVFQEVINESQTYIDPQEFERKKQAKKLKIKEYMEYSKKLDILDSDRRKR